MCGIAGVYYCDWDRQAEAPAVKRMLDVIPHRGPDGEGIYTDRNVGLGHRRLSIIDLSENASQPMCNEDGSIWIVFNGEFFNFQDYTDELRQKGHVLRSRSDTEYVLHLYEEYGTDVVQKMNGMFSFVIWDSRKRRLFGARDRLGVKPFHYYLDENAFLFASEIKSILAFGDIDTSIDEQALSDYFTFMSIPAPKTIFSGIRKLEPGHSFVIERGQMVIRKYWDLEYSVEPKPDAWYLERFEELLLDATRLRLISDVPLGAFLSGGVDSSAVVAMMNKAGAETIKTFSIAFKGQGDFDESPLARRVANQYNTLHTEFDLTADFLDVLPKLIWHYDEPFAVSSGFALYYLSKLTREHVTVALSGDGGDELFAGYPFRYSHDERYNKLARIPMPLRKATAHLSSLAACSGDSKAAVFSRKLRDYSAMASLPNDEAFLKEFSYFDNRLKSIFFSKDFYQKLGDYDSNEVYYQYYGGNVKGSMLFKRQLGDIKTSLADEMLKKVDSMTMAVSLEARTPFLDYRMAEFSASVPDHLKIRGREGKWLVKKVMEKYLPADLLYRKKHGFNVPFGEWARNQLSDYLQDMLSEKRIREAGIFEPKQVQKMLNDHQKGLHNYGSQIYIMLVYELWRTEVLNKLPARGQ